MTFEDKRDECKCHKGCTVIGHECENPCKWPACLDTEELDQLFQDIRKDMEG